MGHDVSQKEGFKIVGAATLKALSPKLCRLVKRGVEQTHVRGPHGMGRVVLVREMRKFLRGLRMEGFCRRKSL